jgi:hypothetical protein
VMCSNFRFSTSHVNFTYYVIFREFLSYETMHLKFEKLGIQMKFKYNMKI